MNYTLWISDRFKPYPNAENTYSLALKRCLNRKNFNAKTDEPCCRCKGSGQLKVSFSYYDSDWEICDRCNGQGFLSKKYYRSWYNDCMLKEKNRKIQEKEIAKELKRIKSKITKKELEFLMKHEKFKR